MKEAQEILRNLALPSEEALETLRKLSRPSEEALELLRRLALPSQEALEMLRGMSRPSEEALEMLRSLSRPSEEALEMLRSMALPAEESQEILRKLALPSEVATVAFRDLMRPSDELVPESSLDEEDEGPSAPVTGDDHIPAAILRLKALLVEGGLSPEIGTRDTDDEVELTFALPAGRDKRIVTVDSDGAAALVEDPNLLDWRSLTSYDGIWNRAASVIEVAVRGERFGLPPRHLLRRPPAPEETDGTLLEVEDPSSVVRLRLGDASKSAQAILGRQGLGRALLTLRCEGTVVSTTLEADELIERLADSLFFDVEVNQGISIVLGRLASGTRPRRWRPHPKKEASFPRSQYPHAPILLYRLGRDRALPPVIRYWALYQVLEYFFPRYSSEEALRRLSRHLLSPSFDPHREEDVLTAISMVGSATGGPERDMLTTTLDAITSAPELRRVIAELGIADVLKKEGKDLSVELVDPQSDDLVRKLAHRVYDVRCRIVHSKSSTLSQLGPGLLAGTAHDDLIQPELPLLEYLAQQAIVASAEPLR